MAIKLGRKATIPPNYLDTQNLQKVPVSQNFTATAGQKVFTLNTAYELGKNQVSVEVEGIPQTLGEGFTETTTTSITLAEGVSAGTKVTVRIFETPAGMNQKLTDLNTLSQKLSADLAQNLQQLNDLHINVKYPPSGLAAPKLDNVTDDSVAIQAIVDYVSANGGGEVYIPKCTFIAKITPKPFVHIRGAGKGVTNMNWNGTDPAINYDGSQPAILKEWSIRGMTISTPNATIGVNLGNYSYGNLAVEIKANVNGTGLRLFGTGGIAAYYLNAEKCKFSLGAVGVEFLDAANANEFTNCVFYGQQIGAKFTNCNGNVISVGTFQDFTVKATEFGNNATQNFIMGNYIEAKAGSAATLITGHHLLAGSLLNGFVANKYSIIRSQGKPELLNDSGNGYLRLEFSGANNNEAISFPVAPKLPVYDTVPVKDPSLRGGLVVQQTASAVDALKWYYRLANGSVDIGTIPVRFNGDMNIGNDRVMAGTVYLTGDVGANIEGTLRWNHSTRKLQVYNGTAWETVTSS